MIGHRRFAKWGIVMADVFISYSKANADLTIELAKALEAKGLTVWWDTDLVAGDAFRQTILSELQASKAVVVIWTQASINSQWVLSEAIRALKLNKLIQVRAPDITPGDAPPPFDVFHIPPITENRPIFAALKKMGIPIDVPEDALNPRSDPQTHSQGNAPDTPLDNQIRARQELARWDVIKDSADQAHFREFLKRFPDGEFADLVNEKLESLCWADLQKSLNDIEPLRGFLRDFPKSRHSAQVSKALENLSSKQERAEWRQIRGGTLSRLFGAKSTLDLGQIETFLSRYPDGVFAPQARDLVEYLRREAVAWTRVQESPDIVVVDQFLATFPDGPNAAEAMGQQARLRQQTPIDPSSNPNSLPTRAPQTAWGTLLVVALVAFFLGVLDDRASRQDILRFEPWGIYLTSATYALWCMFVGGIVYKWGVRSVKVFLYVTAFNILFQAVMAHMYNVAPEEEMSQLQNISYKPLFFFSLWASAALFVKYMRRWMLAFLAFGIGLIYAGLAVPTMPPILVDSLDNAIGCALVAYGLLRAPSLHLLDELGGKVASAAMFMKRFQRHR